MKNLFRFLFLAFLATAIARPQNPQSDSITLANPAQGLMTSGASSVQSGMSSVQNLATLPLQLPLNMLQNLMKSSSDTWNQATAHLADAFERTTAVENRMSKSVSSISVLQMDPTTPRVERAETNINTPPLNTTVPPTKPPTAKVDGKSGE
ncbi:uncharacterized protein LOC113234520 isoform X2 [Hyposmocoma kahamanoa]|uniref:uncharacterized protein LOC113234520 isoform X2 n=1 Tax=Hyposmocoma kahamanoa TaxID=1477025 RepID=UPI000E6D6DAE|nr:uncharacterized protein LOC113234520 isoform X2 [Hyposmocoma kahamanoa]